MSWFHPVRLWLVTDPELPDDLVFNTAVALDEAHGSAVGIWFRDKREHPYVSLARRLVKSMHSARFLAGSAHLARAVGVTQVHEPTRFFAGATERSAPAHSLEEANAAIAAGADALMLSPIFKTKHANGPAGLELIARTRSQHPNAFLYALGGITHENAASCMEAGANGVAVQGAVWSARSPVDAANAILGAVR